MLIFELNNAASHARIWFEPKNNFLFNRYSTSETYYFECNQCQLFDDRTLILEMNINAGPRYIYGLLGVKYHYVDSQKLIAKINLTNKNIVSVDDTLIKMETAYLGLPEEYALAIQSGLNRAYKENKLLLNGTLEFCYAAYGLAYSNMRIFRKLSYLLINLLFFQEKELKEDDFFKVLKSESIENY